MTGWNLPPGCSVSDIPGNGPEDAKAEGICDEIYLVLEKYGISEDGHSQRDDLVEALYDLFSKIETRAVSDALAESRMYPDPPVEPTS